jgi:Protein kinase domain
MGQRSSDNNRGGRISVPVPSSFMTVMPRHEISKGPMTGAYGRPGLIGTTGVPPLAHTNPPPNPVPLFISTMKREVKNYHDDNNHSRSESGCDGYARLLEYMEKCLPSVKGCEKNAHRGGPGTALGLQQRQKEGEVEGEKDAEGEEEGEGDDWRAAQAASTPTLLPTLRFHELVFGQELGKGSFGCVKYARMIIRGKSRSEWPEYAVKIISKDTVTKCEYGSAVIREMAVLQMVSHPGFARLISLFRYTHSAYLVLEYAGRGDLHSMVIRRGPKRKGQSPISLPLSHLCTRFILSELVTALLSIHSIGLSYNDLKPENILITEMGHVKITDFGGCRAFTISAKKSLQDRCKDLSESESLRNGDWRDKPVEEREEDERGPLFGNNLMNFEDDDRFEFSYFVV